MPFSSKTSLSGNTGDILPFERSRASFDVQVLRRILVGTDDQLEKTNKWRQLFDEPLFDNSDDHFHSLEEKYIKLLERSLRSMQILKKNPEVLSAHSPVHGGNPAKQTIHDLSGSSGSIATHYALFVATLLTNASPEQQQIWLPKALKLQILGSYAQTELGHGSNVRAIETTATFDEKMDEFVIDSPTLTSTKWWISAGGIAATHAIVYAQLILKGVSHGYHAFIVQLRDHNHKPLPGVVVGHLGPKLGNGPEADAGFMRFDHVRVPRANMLSRFQQVTREGEYIKPPKKLSKIGYLTMTRVRVGIVRGASVALARAVTIAVRWNAIRKQGFTQGSTQETAIIDYRNQQYYLFGYLSVAYAIGLGSINLSRLLRAFDEELKNKKTEEIDTSFLPELHATSSGLKGFCAEYAAGGIEMCRRACGGQGYALSSGIGTLLVNYLPAVTYEGDRNILALQSARFLVQSIQKQEKLIAAVEYLKLNHPVKITSVEDAMDLDVLINLWQAISKHSVERAATELQRFGDRPDPWNCSQIALIDCAQHHSITVLLRGFTAEVLRIEDASTRRVMYKLAALFAHFMLWEKARSIDVASVATSEHLNYCSAAMNRLLEEIRPDVVSLCDAWNFTDKQLNSCIGRFDGNAYEAIYDWACRSPLNNQDFVAKVATLMGPFLDKDFLMQGNTPQSKL